MFKNYDVNNVENFVKAAYILKSVCGLCIYNWVLMLAVCRKMSPNLRSCEDNLVKVDAAPRMQMGCPPAY